MKHLITLSFLFFLAISNAQGNLQFNQVLTYGGTLCASCNQPIGTVPAGKVWKVESKGGSTVPTVNGNPVTSNSYPFWLKAGDVIGHYTGSAQGWFISIIEFNIVP
jgi:hypothetical protein